MHPSVGGADLGLFCLPVTLHAFIDAIDLVIRQRLEIAPLKATQVGFLSKIHEIFNVQAFERFLLRLSAVFADLSPHPAPAD